MRGTALLIAALLAPEAFGQETPNASAKRQVGPMSALAKIVGQWDLDTVRTLTGIEAEAKTDEEKAALEFAKGMISAIKMKFEFTADGKLRTSWSFGGKTEKKEGTYVVKSEKVSSVVIAGTVDGKTNDVTIKFVDKNTIELIMPKDEGPGTMVLKRAKSVKSPRR